MKMSKIFKEHWKEIIFKPLILIIVVILTCLLLNFILVPPIRSTVIGTIMADVKSQTENIDVLYMGSSRAHNGIDTVTLSKNLNKKIFNISYENSNYLSTFYLLEETLKTNNVEELYLEVSTTNFTRGTSTEDINIYQTLTGETKKEFKKFRGLEYTKSYLFNFVNYKKNFANGMFAQNVKVKVLNQNKIGVAINKQNITYMGNGYIKNERKLKENAKLDLPKTYCINNEFWNENNADEKQVEYFYKIINLCKEKNIKLNFFSAPYPYDIIEKYSEGMDSFDSFIRNIADEKLIEVYDYSKLKKEILTLENKYFYNANHCNYVGADALAPIITEIMKESESQIYINNNWFYNSYAEMIEDYSK